MESLAPPETEASGVSVQPLGPVEKQVRAVSAEPPGRAAPVATEVWVASAVSVEPPGRAAPVAKEVSVGLRYHRSLTPAGIKR